MPRTHLLIGLLLIPSTAFAGVSAVIINDAGAGCALLANKSAKIYRSKDSRNLPEMIADTKTNSDGVLETGLIKNDDYSYRVDVEYSKDADGKPMWLSFDIVTVKPVMVLKTGKTPLVYNESGKVIGRLGVMTAGYATSVRQFYSTYCQPWNTCDPCGCWPSMPSYQPVDCMPLYPRRIDGNGFIQQPMVPPATPRLPQPAYAKQTDGKRAIGGNTADRSVLPPSQISHSRLAPTLHAHETVQYRPKREARPSSTIKLPYNTIVRNEPGR